MKLLAKITFISFLIIVFPLLANSQARLVINNNAYVRMNGGTAVTPVYIVMDNGNANAVSTAGTGGNLVSESEWNILRWNVGTNTGTYTVPYTSNPATTNFKFPQIIQITVAGTGAGKIDFSTYETTTDMNVPWASIVTHMTDADNVPADNSLNVVDRYWINEAFGYTTKPDVNITFGYVDNVSELSGTNTISETNLVAQRWNSGTNQWEGNAANTSICYGAANTATNQVTGVDIPPAEFFEVWVLVDNASLLPVELISMDAVCKDNQLMIEWATGSESNSDYYVIETGNDALNYFPVGEVNAAGNSSTITNYNYILSNTTGSFIRIKQVDMDGHFSYFPVMTVPNCGNTDIQIYSDGDYVYLNYDSEKEEKLNLYLYAADGKLIDEKLLYMEQGNNAYRLDYQLAKGIYFVTLSNNNTFYSNKLYLNK
jgi:hypothetical protein